MAIIKCNESCPHYQHIQTTDENYIICVYPGAKSSWPLICPVIVDNLKEGVYGKV
jgi:hypothetical protein